MPVPHTSVQTSPSCLCHHLLHLLVPSTYRTSFLSFTSPIFSLFCSDCDHNHLHRDHFYHNHNLDHNLPTLTQPRPPPRPHWPLPQHLNHLDCHLDLSSHLSYPLTHRLPLSHAVVTTCLMLSLPHSSCAGSPSPSHCPSYVSCHSRGSVRNNAVLRHGEGTSRDEEVCGIGKFNKVERASVV